MLIVPVLEVTSNLFATASTSGGQIFCYMKALQGLDFIREQVRVRDKHTCQKCGKKWVSGRRFDVHHLDAQMESVKNYSYDKSHMDLMITLCHKCHLGLPHIKQNIIGRTRKIDYELVFKLRESGVTFNAIARDFKTSRQRVHHAYWVYKKELSTRLI